jgi:transcriptional regulator with GAF, ATPase, and Fis domain
VGVDQLSQFQGVVIRPSMRLALERIVPALNSDVTVLLVGETGTGKGVVARAIHDRSSRRTRAFLKCDCAAVSSQLIESELFGHEKGAFTGASGCHVGFFEQAGAGTLFLDEIAELSRGSQVKLLGALQDRLIQRVGGTASIPVNARVIAATNRDIEAEVSAGRFRSDLYHRLNVLKIELPPLRKTPEDLEPMTRYFVEVYSRAIGRRAPSVSAKMLSAMREYPWPGNLRELEHFVQRSVLLSPSETLEPEEFPDPQLGANLKHEDSSPARTLAEVEADHIIKVLEAANWRINGRGGAAKVLGLHPSTLRFRMARLNLRRPSVAIK